METAKRVIRNYRGSINPPYNRKDILVVLGTLFILFAIPLTVMAVFTAKEPIVIAGPAPGPVRGLAGDLWADVIIGQPDFSEITPNEVVPNKLFIPFGGNVVVDRSVSPGRLYVWDGGNSRILGIDLATCYASGSSCSADIVIGQPSGFDHSACNGDGGFQSYPERVPASASSLCGLPEPSLSLGEGISRANMTVDADGNLYVPDQHNNRILKYNSPFQLIL